MQQMMVFVVRMNYLMQSDLLSLKVRLPPYVEGPLHYVGRSYKDCFVASGHTMISWCGRLSLRRLRGVLSWTSRAFYHSFHSRLRDSGLHFW